MKRLITGGLLALILPAAHAVDCDELNAAYQNLADARASFNEVRHLVGTDEYERAIEAYFVAEDAVAGYSYIDKALCAS